MPGPLRGIRVLDVTNEVAGSYAARLLAGYGAETIKIEPPEGTALRNFGPFPDNQQDIESSGLYLHLNANKSSFVTDVSTKSGSEKIKEWSSELDILIEDFPPGKTKEWGWDWETLKQLNPQLVMTSITPFGQSGPYRNYRGSEITLQAIGGPLIQTGHPGREPLKNAGHFANYHAGIMAAYAAMLARLKVEKGGAGDWIDISIYECQSGSRDRRTATIAAASYAGVTGARYTSTSRGPGIGLRQCKDGYINIYGGGPRLPALIQLIGRDDLLANNEVHKGSQTLSENLYKEIETSYENYLATHTRQEIIEAAQNVKLPCGALNTTADLFEDPHFIERGVWETIDHPKIGPFKVPRLPILFSKTPQEKIRAAPLLGENNNLHLAPRKKTPKLLKKQPSLPLEGIRIAEITVVWAGTHVTQLLGEWGAEVIRVEPINRIQASTRGADIRMGPKRARQVAEMGLTINAYPDFEPHDDPWNRSPSFNTGARNKKSMTCDIMSTGGREAFLRLLEKSDVFVENNVPTTIKKAGLTWEEIRKINPRLIMLRMPAFGLSGPYRDFRGFGMHVEALLGHTHIRGYPDTSPKETGTETLASDVIAGVHGALAVSMALRHREQTGEGQLIELALAESFLPILGEFLADYEINKKDTEPQGNSHRWHAPHGVYPCKGKDRWIAIDIATNEEFMALCKVLNGVNLVQDHRFSSPANRLRNRLTLDNEIKIRTKNFGHEELFHKLQSVGVCAAPTHDGIEALADPHLNERNFFEEQTMENIGTHRYAGLTFRMTNTPNKLRLPPPKLGEHNEWAYKDLLGYSEQEYAAFRMRNEVGESYPDELLPPLTE